MMASEYRSYGVNIGSKKNFCLQSESDIHWHQIVKKG